MAAKEEISLVYDVAIIGTGLYGIQAARYYLDIHPDAHLVLLEADDVIGGTWSSKRIYQGFWTQTPTKLAEFSDRPMTPPPEEDQYWGFFPAKYFTSYLESYVDDHTYAGRTIRERILFKSRVNRVTEVQPSENVSKGGLPTARWAITYNSDSLIETSKLIDATGMTSQPDIPHLPGLSDFKGRTLHHKSFGEEESSLLSDPSIQNVCILGGAKSAMDVAYAFGKAADEKNIHWIIREDGNGPAAFFSVQPVDARYANSNESFYNRYVSGYLPSYFSRWTLWKWLLQWTYFGRRHVEKFWAGVDQGLRGLTDYQREQGKKTGFPNLEPDTPLFWQNDSSGVANRPDFISTLASKVNIYRRDISCLSADSIVLKPRFGSSKPGDNETLILPIDALIFCTGWSSTSTLFSPNQASNYGLAVSLEDANPQAQSYWQGLEKAADPVILSRFPTLRSPPKYRKIEPKQTPFRLYKGVAPPVDVHNTHSIVFLGKLVVGNNFCTAEVQALWAVAYLDGRIKSLPSKSQIEKEVAETVAWNRRRYLNKGQLGSWFYFDVVDYCDGLLEQLGLNSHRKGKGWVGELLDPYFSRDLKGLVGEYKEKYESQG